MTTIKVNGVQLHFELAGHSEEPLVLVHGSWIDPSAIRQRSA